MGSAWRLGAGVVMLSLVASLAVGVDGAGPARAETSAPWTTCPSTRSGEVVGDPQRALCATMATAIGTQETARDVLVTLPARLRCRVPPADPGGGEVAHDVAGAITGAGASIRLTNRDEANCDTLVSADARGGHTTLYFPRGSLILNFPSDGAFDPNLPIGILTTGPGLDLVALTTPPHRPEIRRERDGGPSPLLSQTGLTLLATHVLEVASNSTNSNTNDHAYAAASFKFYKPSQRDSDPNYDYRELYGTGSAKGGNFFHQLTEARLRNRLVSPPKGQAFVEWRPNGTKELSSGSQDITITLTSVAPGVEASVSHSFTIRPQKYGVLYIDPATRFDFGWTNQFGMGCCDYVGLGGGSEFRYKPANGYAKRVQVRICWSDDLQTTCKWGSEAG